MRIEGVPIPPSTNHLYRWVNGRPIKSREYRAWIKLAGQVVSIKTAAVGVVPPPYRITMELSGGNGHFRRRDLDNFAKSILDMLKSVGVIEEDNLNVLTEIRMRYERCDGEAKLTILIDEPEVSDG